MTGLGGMSRRLEQQSMLRVLIALACSAYVFFTFTFRNEGVEHGGTGDSIDLHYGLDA